MFDISMGEFILILIIMIAFLGPERIPVVAKKVGEFIHMIKSYFTQLTEEITENKEAEQVFNEVQQTVKDIATVVNVKKAVREMGKPLFEIPINNEEKKKNTIENSTENINIDISKDLSQENIKTPSNTPQITSSIQKEIEFFSTELSGNNKPDELEQPFRVFDPNKDK